MSSCALITGALFKAPEQRISKSGSPFTMATVRVQTANGLQFWRAFAFDDDVRAELDRLQDGDRLTLQGPMSAEVYQAERGPRINLAITADFILALRQVAKPRERASNRNAGGERAIA